MKLWIKGLSFCFLLSLMSCASTMSMFIDVEKPAAVTLPVTAMNVIIVNNVLPQPVGYGLNAPLDKQADSIAKALTFAPWRVVMATYGYMYSSGFFSDVSLYRKSLRTGDDWLVVTPVGKEVRNDFFDNENFDLLISIDRLLFNSANEPNKIEAVKMTSLLTFSAYLPGEDQPIIRTSITDSVNTDYSEIIFSGGVPYFLNYEEMVTAMIQHSTARLGEKLGGYFVPGWDTAERIYFTRNLSDGTKMANYINKGNWAEAISVWTDKFDKAKKTVDKAKLATNIALAYEMKDEFKKAIEWAKKSKSFFENVSSEKYVKETAYLDGYIKALLDRELNNLKLNLQYGVAE